MLGPRIEDDREDWRDQIPEPDPDDGTAPEIVHDEDEIVGEVDEPDWVRNL